VEFEFPGCKGLSFDLAFLSKESHQDLYKKCMKMKVNARTRKPEEEFDDDMFLKLYVASIVRGWKGFKIKYVQEFVLAKVDSVDPEDELEFSEENALQLMRASTIFDNWVSELLLDLGNFTSTVSNAKLEGSKDTSKKTVPV